MFRMRFQNVGYSALVFALVAAMLASCGPVVSTAGLRIEIVPVGAYVARSQTAAFLVTLQREKGFSGSVALALPGAPAGVSAAGAVSAGADEGELLVTIGPDAALGPVVLRLVASGWASDGAVLRRELDFIVTVLDEARPTLYLVGAAGSPPPANVHEEIVVPDHGDAWLLELVVLGGALVLEPDGDYQHLLTIDTLQDGRLVGRSRWADHGMWTATGTGLAFTSTWVEGHAFTGIRTGADVAIAFDLHPLVGEHTSADLAFRE